MRRTTIYDSPRWYAVQTKPHKDALVRSCFEEQGIGYYEPRLATPKKKGRVEPLSPRYLLARIGSMRECLNVRYTWGVKRVVGYGDRPYPVDDELIDVIRSRESEDGVIRPSKVFRFKAKERVRLKGGSLDALEAIFRRYLPARCEF